MANEIRGILAEVIVYKALQRAVEISGIEGNIYWNQKPSTLTINPDFTIGLNSEEPSHLILVTASGASHNSHMKMWRNLAEVFEGKSHTHSTAALISIYALSRQKEMVRSLIDEIVDYGFHIDDYPYSNKVFEWIALAARRNLINKEEKLAFLDTCLKSDQGLSSAIASLAQDLAQALQRRKTELDPVWALMQIDYAKPHNPPKAKNTSVRRGLGKLLVLEPQLRQLVYAGYNKPTGVHVDNVPQYAWDLGFFKKSLVGAKVADKEIDGALALLGATACETVLQKAPQSMSIWINPLRDLGRVDAHVEFIENHYDQVTDPDSLEQLLVQCFNDPAGLSGVAGDEKVWIYEIMISLLKAKSGRLQGYGLAQLATDTGVPDFGAGGFVIPPFIQREKMLSPERLQALATGLAKRFAQNVSHSDIGKLRTKVEQWVIKENLEDRLIPYRNFEPLLWLLEAELTKQGKPYSPKVPYIGWVNEYAGTGKNSATTPFVKVGSTLIHWKSAHASHPNDKTKELSARARSVKYQYHPATKTFTPRAGVTQLALIVDGDWSDRHLQTLSSSGWDIIVYPDEIPQLINQL